MPTVARVHGDCLCRRRRPGRGVRHAVSAEGVHFCLSEVKLGLMPATIRPYVIRALGERAARRYFLTAERFSAAEALRIGFVHELVTADAIDAKVTASCRRWCTNGPAAVKASKQLVQDLAASR